MATRSLIGYEKSDGTIIVSYCHFDGYLTGVGADLLALKPSAVKKIVDAGDMSTLKSGPYTPVVKPKVFTSRGDAVDHFEDSWCEYFYLLSTSRTWFYSEHGHSKGIFHPLKAAVKQAIENESM